MSYVAIDNPKRAAPAGDENYEQYKHVTCSAYSGVCVTTAGVI